MKKANKKNLFVLIITLISTFSITSLQVNAVHESHICDIENCNLEYTYEHMTAEKAEQIVNSMFGIPDDTPTPRNLLCLFGHNIQYGTITTTEHYYYSQYPSCRQTVNAIDYCSRSGCDYFQVVDEIVVRIGCH